MTDLCEGVNLTKDWTARHPPDPGAADQLCQLCRSIMKEAEASQVSEWERLCMLIGERYEHFYHSRLQLSVCGNHPAWRVRLVLDETGSYWGWLYSHHPINASHKGEVSMVYPSRMAVEMCFTYGPDVETKRCRGRIVRLRVEPLRPALASESIIRQESK